jgi:hypothetical protein
MEPVEQLWVAKAPCGLQLPSTKEPITQAGMPCPSPTALRASKTGFSYGGFFFFMKNPISPVPAVADTAWPRNYSGISPNFSFTVRYPSLLGNFRFFRQITHFLSS